MSFIAPELPPAAQRPAPYLKWFEARAPFEFAALAPYAPWLLSAPRGDGRPIVLSPGFFADSNSMAPLSAFLSYLGYRPMGWGLGRNNGNVEEDIERLGQRVNKLFEELDGMPLTLIGWSLGGVISREVAREHPEQVREVITMGTPVIGGPKYTTVGDVFANRRGIDLDALELEVHERNRQGLTQPVTSIYSKSDGVVGWRAAIDNYNPQARNIEVSSSHIGLGVNPAVWRIIANTLAAVH